MLWGKNVLDTLGERQGIQCDWTIENEGKIDKR